MSNQDDPIEKISNAGHAIISAMDVIAREILTPQAQAECVLTLVIRNTKHADSTRDIIVTRDSFPELIAALQRMEKLQASKEAQSTMVGGKPVLSS